MVLCSRAGLEALGLSSPLASAFLVTEPAGTCHFPLLDAEFTKKLEYGELTKEWPYVCKLYYCKHSNSHIYVYVLYRHYDKFIALFI